MVFTLTDEIDFDARKHWVPVYCPQCNEDGYIFVDRIDDSCFAKYKACGWKVAITWCPNCKMSGDYIRDIDNPPSIWVCPTCTGQYYLPSSFYQNPIQLYLEKDLPTDVRDRIKNDIDALSKLNKRKKHPHYLTNGQVLILQIVLIVAFIFVYPKISFYFPSFELSFLIWVFLVLFLVRFFIPFMIQRFDQ